MRLKLKSTAKTGTVLLSFQTASTSFASKVLVTLQTSQN